MVCLHKCYSGSDYDVTNFLATLYSEGLTYSTLCGYRITDSSINYLVDENNIGENPPLVRLLNCMFNLKPPLKQPVLSWDINHNIHC